jgi:hypothetical protein
MNCLKPGFAFSVIALNASEYNQKQAAYLHGSEAEASQHYFFVPD